MLGVASWTTEHDATAVFEPTSKTRRVGHECWLNVISLNDIEADDGVHQRSCSGVWTVKEIRSQDTISWEGISECLNYEITLLLVPGPNAV